MEKEIETFYAKSRQEWREWLQVNHNKKQSVWLIFYKKKSNIPSVTYSEAVDEGLCFGWIDSKAKPLDDEKYMQFFSRRKANSVWSKINKEKIERLIDQGLMTVAGFETIEQAKQNGSWTILDEAEANILPDDLEKALQSSPIAKQYFSGLSRSDKRNILQWLVLAKRQETREKRINEIVELADKKQKPKQFNGQKKEVCEEEQKPNDSFLALIGAPARRALEGENIKTLNDLAKWSERDLLKLHGMGPGSIPKLKKTLNDNGLSFSK